MKRMLIAGLVVALMLVSGCTGAPAQTAGASPSAAAVSSPTPAVTTAPTATDTVEPTPTPAPTETSAPKQPDVQAGGKEFIFAEYTLLAVYYDPQIWVSDKGMGQGYLESQSIEGCSLTDVYASQPPENPATITLGDFSYLTAQTVNPTSGEVTSWYVMGEPLPEAYASQSIDPYFLITSPGDRKDDCIPEMEAVLSTLHLVEQ